jgi:hypothetical protein
VLDESGELQYQVVFVFLDTYDFRVVISDELCYVYVVAGVIFAVDNDIDWQTIWPWPLHEVGKH